MTTTVGSLFSGVGGLDLAVHAHFNATPAWFVEANPYCQQVLAKRWPGVPIHNDVREVNAATLGVRPDILVGGPPCTDLSASSPTKTGLDGARSGLFYQLARIANELEVPTIVIENVPALLSKWRGAVEDALPDYGITWVKVSAAHIEGCPHLRWRVFLVCKRGAQDGGVVTAGKAPAADRWPTHKASLSGPDFARASRKRSGGDDLVTAIARWASPAARDYRSGTGYDRAKHYPGRIGSDQLPEQMGGRLNADWVEALMGFSVGWTDIDCDKPASHPFPAPMSKQLCGDSPQFDWEPPRTVTGRQKNRRARLTALGNAVVTQQAMRALNLAGHGPRQASLFGASHLTTGSNCEQGVVNNSSNLAAGEVT